MKYAFINDNEVKNIEDTTEELAFSESHLYQQVISVEGLSPEPQVGWHWENGILFKYFPAINPRQIREALLYLGVDLSMIDAALDSLPEPTRSFAKVKWNYAPTYERNDALVSSVALLLGWTEEQIDYLWSLGGSL